MKSVPLPKPDGHEEELSALVREIEARYQPGKHDSARHLGYLLEQLISHAPEQAAELFLKLEVSAARMIPLISDLLYQLTRQLLSKKALAQAEVLWQLGRQWQFPLDVLVAVQFTKIWMQSGQTAKARELLQTIVKGESCSTDALLALYELEKREGRGGDAHALLTRMTEADASLSTVTFAYRERQKLSQDSGRSIRIALLSSYVIDNLIPYLDAECRKAGLAPEFFLAPFNQYAQEIMAPSSRLYDFGPEIVFLMLGIEDVFPEILEFPSAQELAKVNQEITDLALMLAGQLEKHSTALFVLNEFMFTHSPPHGILDNRIPEGLVPWVDQLNRGLAEALRVRQRAYLLPFRQVMAWVGIERSQNPKMQYMASMRTGEAALKELARYCVRYLKPLKGLTKKCVVLDLDGTLWGGIVGELGVEGIHLGPSAPGAEYVDFQRALLNLTRRGIVLAICSKNNPEDVLPVLREHEYMLLREEQFAAMRINWCNKAENIKEIAEELNIGLDSLVFVDDNPNERELIRQLLPEVLTVDLPRDPSRYRITLESLSDFELLAITKEDEMRVAQYQAIGKRQAMRRTAGSLEDYLHSLALKVTIERAKPETLNRLVQMFNKTNQFNLTTRRYQTADIERCLRSDEYKIYTLEVSDRFVDHGIVGSAVVRIESNQWCIESLLMSCRVMGLTIEQTFLVRLCQDALDAGTPTVLGEFIPSKKNHPVKDFYAQHGFTLNSDDGAHQLWVYDLASFKMMTPPWITVTATKVHHDS